MDSFEVGSLGRLRFERGDGIAQVGSANAFEHGTESLWALGMAGPGKMFEVHRMSGEQHGHAVGRYLAAGNSELPFHP